MTERPKDGDGRPAPLGPDTAGVVEAVTPPTSSGFASPSTPPDPAGSATDANETYGPISTRGDTYEADEDPSGTDVRAAAQRIGETAATAGEEMAQTVKQQAGDVAHTVKQQASEVASEAKHQAASLVDTIRTEVGEQSSTQQQRVAGALHEASAELGSMAAGSSKPDWLTELMREAARRGEEISHWLQDREPAEVVDAVCAYARRRPVTFLALCCLVGVLAGRLTRSAVATNTSLDSPAVPGIQDRPLPELDAEESTRAQRIPDPEVRGGEPVR